MVLLYGNFIACIGAWGAYEQKWFVVIGLGFSFAAYGTQVIVDAIRNK